MTRGNGAGLGHTLEQLGGFVGRRAEFAGEFQDRAAQGRGDAHEDAQIFRAAGFGQKLVEFEIAIHHIIGDAIFLERDLGRAGKAHRRHEMANGVGKAGFDQLDLAQRRGIEMADAGGPDLFQRLRTGVGLDGVERVAGKGGETFRHSAEALGMKQIEGHAGFFRGDSVGDGSVARQRLDADRSVQSQPLKKQFEASLGQEGWLGKISFGDDAYTTVTAQAAEVVEDRPSRVAASGHDRVPSSGAAAPRSGVDRAPARHKGPRRPDARRPDR